MNPVRLYRWSAYLEQRGAKRAARLVEAANFVLFKAIIPPQLEAGSNFKVGHYGFGVVIHPNTTIGDDVSIGHQVTLGTDIDPRDPRRMRIGDKVVIGAGAMVLGPLTIGDRAVIGAGAVVTHDVAADTVVAGVPARPVRPGSPPDPTSP
jgi:serine O-acetyltransferase